MRSLEREPTRQNTRRPRGYWTQEKIEEEARNFINEFGVLSKSLLKKNRLSGLQDAIYKRYPGGIKELKENLGVAEQVSQAEELMKEMKEVRVLEDSERLLRVNRKTKRYTDSEGQNWITRNYLVSKWGLSHPFLTELLADIPSLQAKNAINRPVLLYNEAEAERVLNKYQQTLPRIDPKTKRYTDPEGEEWVTAYFLTKTFGPSGTKLKQIFVDIDTINGRDSGNRTTLLYNRLQAERVLKDHGFHPLKKPKEKKIIHRWSKESVEQEARDFFQKYGNLTPTLLETNGQSGLSSAITKYPGGMYALKRKLGIEITQVPKGFWTPERIEEEAFAFYSNHGSLSMFRKKGRGNLASAIERYYPGKIRALREKLAIRQERLARGYWTIERIEEEAREFYSLHGRFSRELLIRERKSELRSAISRNYPGGMQALKEKLGVQKEISSEKANEYIKGLVK